MSEWMKVVTQPLGLAGFALFLVFGYLAKAKRNDERRWLSLAAMALAAVALMGSLFIAYRQISKPSLQPAQTIQAQAPTSQQPNSHVEQRSTGEGSPNVQGDVTITVDQSKGKTGAQKAPSKGPQ